MNFKFNVRPALYDNDVSAWIPKLWALATIDVLEANTMALMTVNQDFSEAFASPGDTVNTRRPHAFKAYNKRVNDDVTDQAVLADNVPVVLNQHIHVSFTIDDKDQTLSFPQLIPKYVENAGKALADRVDKIVLGQAYRFLHNQAGSFGGLSNTNGVAALTGVRKVLQKNYAPEMDRWLAVGPNSEALLLQNTVFHEVDKSGFTAGLRDAVLGQKFGFNCWGGQNVPSLADGVNLGSGTVNNSGGYPAGTTTLTVSNFASDELKPGDWIKLGGYLYHVTATNNQTATSMTLEYGLKAAVANTDPIVVYDECTVDNADDYALGWDKEIAIDDLGSNAPQVGQMVTFTRNTGGVGTDRYAIVDTDGATYIMLDRPLEIALEDDDVINLGPIGGDIDLAYQRNAMTVAIRPLTPIEDGIGASSAVVSARGLTVRATISYDGKAQKRRVTLDFLLGVQVLDDNKAAVMLA